MMKFPVREFDRSDPRWAILLAGLEGSESDVPEAAGSSVYVTDLATVRTSDELVSRAIVDFAIPYPISGLDAILSMLADLDWAPNPRGYLWRIHGLPALRAMDQGLFVQLVRLTIHLCDRWRSRAIPFRVVVHGDVATLRAVKREIALEHQRFRDNRKPWIDFEEPAVLEWVAGTWRTASQHE